jgi:hypothetical protein
MAGEWFVAREKKRYGPFTWPQLCQRATDGRLFRTDMVHRAGEQKWKPAGEVEGLFPAASTPPATRHSPATKRFLLGAGSAVGVALLVMAVILAYASGPSSPRPADSPAPTSPAGSPEAVKKEPAQTAPEPANKETDDLQGIWLAKEAGGVSSPLNGGEGQPFFQGPNMVR